MIETDGVWLGFVPPGALAASQACAERHQKCSVNSLVAVRSFTFSGLGLSVPLMIHIMKTCMCPQGRHPRVNLAPTGRGLLRVLLDPFKSVLSNSVAVSHVSISIKIKLS